MFTQDFIDAFTHGMKYEVGPWFNPADPEVISGLIATKDQRRKVGYSNDPEDAGGETKFGIARNANPDQNITGMTLEDAMVVYNNRYWLTPNCNGMDPPVSILHFDGCINHGVPQAGKFLQRALGVTDDGQVGARTLAALKAADRQAVMQSILDQRRQFYNNLVARKPNQAKFLNGWLARIDDVQQFVMNYQA